MTATAPSPQRATARGSSTAARTQSLENRRCPRRVRHEVRDGLAVMAFTAAASTVTAVTLTLLLSLLLSLAG